MNALKAAYRLLVKLGNSLQSPLLLAMRLYWGWPLFQTGKGKLMNLDRTAEFFSSLKLSTQWWVSCDELNLKSSSNASSGRGFTPEASMRSAKSRARTRQTFCCIAS